MNTFAYDKNDMINTIIFHETYQRIDCSPVHGV